MQSTMNKVQVDHDVDVALRSLQRGIVANIFLTSCLNQCVWRLRGNIIGTALCWIV